MIQIVSICNLRRLDLLSLIYFIIYFHILRHIFNRKEKKPEKKPHFVIRLKIKRATTKNGVTTNKMKQFPALNAIIATNSNYPIIVTYFVKNYFFVVHFLSYYSFAISTNRKMKKKTKFIENIEL